MKIVKADGFEFRFEDALDAFVFDEKDSTKATFHGAPMKPASGPFTGGSGVSQRPVCGAIQRAP